MPQKLFDVPGIGEVLIVKRRGSKNLRLTILADGRVRVGMPTWLPYAAGVKFAFGRSDWITNARSKQTVPLLKNGDLIGKSHRLALIYTPTSSNTSSRINGHTIHVKSHLPTDTTYVQKKISSACERALKKEADNLLSQRLKKMSDQSNLVYKNLRIKKLSSRWGSCSHDKTITLSLFLIQLPWHLIDYVIMHELIHTVHLNHGRDFWQAFEAQMPKARSLRKEVNRYRPTILPNGLSV